MTAKEAWDAVVEALDATTYADQIEVLVESLNNTDTSWKDEYEKVKTEKTVLEDKYNKLYDDYKRRFKEAFSPENQNVEYPDIHNTDTTFTEKDIMRFDFSGKNE